MNITKRILLLSLLSLMAFPAALQAQANRKSDITGTIYRDLNKNGRFDGQDKIGKRSQVWLYRVLPDGRRKKIGRQTTDSQGRYCFSAMPTGKYFLAVRFRKNLAVRTAPFVLKGVNRIRVSNIPMVTRQTINRYRFLGIIANPANLDTEAGASPFSPGT